MSFRPLLGYRQDDPNRTKYEPLPKAGPAVDISEPYTQWQAPLVVQQYSDCVERSITSRMRARLAMMDPEKTDGVASDFALPSARWAYWQYLDSIGGLGTDPGTQPWDLIQLLNDRGWCEERWMPYEGPAGRIPLLTVQVAPTPEALRHAFDQRGTLRAHQLVDRESEIQIALRQNLGVVVPFACDKRIVSGDIPNDPEFVWDYDPAAGFAGWHMIQCEGYHPAKGLLLPNTWGTTFGFGGRVWMGWKTYRDTALVHAPIALDWLPESSEGPS